MKAENLKIVLIKLKIKKVLEKENIKIGTTAIETILKDNNLYKNKKKKVKLQHRGKNAIYIKESGTKCAFGRKGSNRWLRRMLFLVKYTIIRYSNKNDF